MDTAEALRTILGSQQLLIRGWKLTPVRSPINPTENRQAWPIYATPPETDEHGVIVNPEKTQVLFYLPSEDVVFRADFEYTDMPFVFGGRRYVLGPGVIEKQVIEFADEKEMMYIRMQTRPVRIYTSETILPAFETFADRVTEWAEKMYAAQTETEKRYAKWVLAELSAVRTNARNAVALAISQLENTVRQMEPDYWLLLEQVMMGTITPEECIKKGRGAIEITLDPDKYVPPSKPQTTTIQ